jgi:hypothetical protein
VKFQSKKIILKNFYITSICYIIYAVIAIILQFSNNVIFSPQLKSNLINLEFSHNRPVIGIYSSALHMGESANARRLQVAASNLGWDSFVVLYSPIIKNIPIINFPFVIANELLKILFKPEFNLVITALVNILPPHPRYLFLDVSPSWLLKNDVRPKEQFANIAEYDGYIDINQNSTQQQDSKWFRTVLENLSKKHVPIIKGVQQVNSSKYKECVPKKLTVFGSNYGKLKSSKKYQQMFKELVKKNYIEFYGPAESWNHVKDAYKGLLSGTQLLSKLQDNCIGLVIHNENHLEAGIPSTRIFETIAAGGIAISDKNSFIIKNFGDNVLYFDHNASSEDMVKQIDDHMRWIFSHPNEVKSKAKAAHQIFLENFTAEKFLLSVKQMNNTYSKK